MVKGVLLILVATLGIVLMNTCAKISSLAHGPVDCLSCGGRGRSSFENYIPVVCRAQVMLSLDNGKLTSAMTAKPKEGILPVIPVLIFPTRSCRQCAF